MRYLFITDRIIALFLPSVKFTRERFCRQAKILVLRDSRQNVADTVGRSGCRTWAVTSRRLINGKTRYSDCKVGDHVLFSQFGKTRLTFEDKPLLALRYEHVHAIVDDPSLFGANIERAVGDEDFKR